MLGLAIGAAVVVSILIILIISYYMNSSSSTSVVAVVPSAAAAPFSAATAAASPAPTSIARGGGGPTPCPNTVTYQIDTDGSCYPVCSSLLAVQAVVAAYPGTVYTGSGSNCLLSGSS